MGLYHVHVSVNHVDLSRVWRWLMEVTRLVTPKAACPLAAGAGSDAGGWAGTGVGLRGVRPPIYPTPQDPPAGVLGCRILLLGKGLSPIAWAWFGALVLLLVPKVLWRSRKGRLGRWG